jgi:hypothetical protein
VRQGGTPLGYLLWGLVWLLFWPVLLPVAAARYTKVGPNAVLIVAASSGAGGRWCGPSSSKPDASPWS